MVAEDTFRKRGVRGDATWVGDRIGYVEAVDPETERCKLKGEIGAVNRLRSWVGVRTETGDEGSFQSSSSMNRGVEFPAGCAINLINPLFFRTILTWNRDKNPV